LFWKIASPVKALVVEKVHAKAGGQGGSPAERGAEEEEFDSLISLIELIMKPLDFSAESVCRNCTH
jgi:hypothetical protein